MNSKTIISFIIGIIIGCLICYYYVCKNCISSNIPMQPKGHLSSLAHVASVYNNMKNLSTGKKIINDLDSCRSLFLDYLYLDSLIKYHSFLTKKEHQKFLGFRIYFGAYNAKNDNYQKNQFTMFMLPLIANNIKTINDLKAQEYFVNNGKIYTIDFVSTHDSISKHINKFSKEYLAATAENYYDRR